MSVHDVEEAIGREVRTGGMSDDDVEQIRDASRPVAMREVLLTPQNLNSKSSAVADAQQHDDNDNNNNDDLKPPVGSHKLKRRKRSKKIITFAESSDPFMPPPDSGRELTRNNTMERLTGVHKAKVRRHLSKKHASFTTPTQQLIDEKRAGHVPMLKAKPSVVITP